MNEVVDVEIITELAAEDRAVNWAGGEAKAFIHVAGYTLKLGFDRLEWLLVEERWRRCGFDDIAAFAESVKINENFQPVAEKRKKLAVLFKQAEKDDLVKKTKRLSNRKIAKALNVPKDTINRDLGSNAPRGQKNASEIKGDKVESGANAPPALPDSFDAAKMAAKRAAKPDETQRRQERDDKLQGMAKALPEGKFSVIYADPPWRHDEPFDNSFSRGVENHYPTMMLEEICALKIPEICADDCTLYLWATAPKLAECLKVIETWGFEYRTNFVWIKDKIGLGWHNRNQHELLLVAKRGALPVPDNSDRISSVIVAPREEHSAKPRLVMDKLAEWYPHVRKIELFNRGAAAPGWSGWGFESDE